jgi:hypothetical protein
VDTEVVWHGTAEEANDFATALGHNCTCQYDSDGSRIGTCAAHVLAEDQRTIDRLVFARYMAARLVEQEFGLPSVRDARG